VKVLNLSVVLPEDAGASVEERFDVVHIVLATVAPEECDCDSEGIGEGLPSVLRTSFPSDGLLVGAPSGADDATVIENAVELVGRYGQCEEGERHS
jgi:hypothetical protein